MNKIILLGNLTRDPEIRYTQGEKPLTVARFDLAVNRKYVKEGEDSADFFHCVAFGKQAEFVKKYFKKASRMLLVGHVQNNNYTNKNGEKVYSIQILCDELEFAERKSSSDRTAGQNSGTGQNLAGAEDFSSIPDDSALPFI